MNLTIFQESYDHPDDFSCSPPVEIKPPKVSHCQVTGRPCAILHDLELCNCHGKPIVWAVNALDLILIDPPYGAKEEGMKADITITGEKCSG